MMRLCLLFSLPVPGPKMTGVECVEGMASGLYEELFATIVSLVNRYGAAGHRAGGLCGQQLLLLGLRGAGMLRKGSYLKSSVWESTLILRTFRGLPAPCEPALGMKDPAEQQSLCLAWGGTRPVAQAAWHPDLAPAASGWYRLC